MERKVISQCIDENDDRSFILRRSGLVDIIGLGAIFHFVPGQKEP
jgi:hypothetical protein